MSLRTRVLGPAVAVAAGLRALAQRAEPWSRTSYAQEGEDCVLERLMGDVPTTGWYVDVGAHHPVRFSNTYAWYRRGWRGVVIEPNVDAAAMFTQLRPRDVFVAAGVGDTRGTLTYHRFDEGALNTFDPTIAQAHVAAGRYRLRDTIQVPVERLDTLLARHLPVDARVDFLSVDVEGFDLAVLRSADWTRFRPRFVLAEALGFDADAPDALAHPLAAFLRGHGYRWVAKTLNTLFFESSPPRTGYP
jgi:FkbM family methyltransferase